MADVDLAAARADYEAYRADREEHSGMYVPTAEAAAKRIPALLDEITRLRALADDVMRFRDAYREDLDRAEKDLDELRSRLDRAEVEATRLRERLADAEHEREVLREGAADLDERLQLALKDEGRARADYDAAALLLGRALVERDQARAQRNAAMREQATQVREVERLRSALAALTRADGEVA